MNKKADLSVTIYFPDGKPFISYDNSIHEIEITEGVVTAKTQKAVEEFHGFPFVLINCSRIRQVNGDG